MPDTEGNGYQGPREFVPTNVVNIRELQQIENFEGQTAWAIGLDRQRDFTVSTLADPCPHRHRHRPRGGRSPRADDDRAGRLAPADSDWPTTANPLTIAIRCPPSTECHASGISPRGTPMHANTRISRR